MHSKVYFYEKVWTKRWLPFFSKTTERVRPLSKTFRVLNYIINILKTIITILKVKIKLVKIGIVDYDRLQKDKKIDIFSFYFASVMFYLY